MPLQPQNRVLADVAAPDRVIEDPVQRDQRAADRLSRQSLLAQLADQLRDVVGRDLLQPLLPERR